MIDTKEFIPRNILMGPQYCRKCRNSGEIHNWYLKLIKCPECKGTGKNPNYISRPPPKPVSSGPKKKRKKEIEYKVIYGGRDGIPLAGDSKDYWENLEEGLNELGKKGWKLGGIGGKGTSIFIFWREKR